jgi:hypothetical protein
MMVTKPQHLCILILREEGIINIVQYESSTL